MPSSTDPRSGRLTSRAVAAGACSLAAAFSLLICGCNILGPGLYERNGFRMEDAPGGYDQAGPTLG